MKLKFVKDAYVDGVLFASEGEIKDVPEEKGSAQRWINRGAVPVEQEVKEEKVLDNSIEQPDFEKMDKKELLKFAEDNNIEIPKDVNKVADIKSFLKSLFDNAEVLVEDEF